MCPAISTPSRDFESRFNTPPDTDEEGPKPLATRTTALVSQPVGLQASSLLPSPSTASLASIPTRNNTALRTIRIYNTKGFIKHIQSQRRRRRGAKLHIRESEYQAAVLELEKDASLLEFFRDELRFDYNRRLQLFVIYMLSTEHEKATEILVAAITEFLDEASSSSQPDQLRCFATDIHNERSRSIVYEAKADPDFADDPDESEAVPHTPSRQLRPRPITLSHSTPTNPSTPASSAIASSPLSITESSIMPDCCWRHQSDAIPRVAVEIAKTQDVRALEEKVDVAIRAAQLNIVFGLILHHSKPRTDRQQDHDIEDGDVVLKIWEVNDKSTTHATGAPRDSLPARDVCLRSNLVLLRNGQIPPALECKLETPCYLSSFISEEALAAICAKEPAGLTGLVVSHPAMKLDLHKLARQLKQANDSAARIERPNQGDQGYQQALDEIRGLVAKRKRDSGNEVDVTASRDSTAARRRLR